MTFFKILVVSIIGSLVAVRPAIPDTLEADTTAVVFLTTSPINADLLLDGRPLQEQTPLLLRGLKPGVHELEIRKRGYRTEQRGLSLTAGEVQSVSIDLASLYFSPALPEEEGLVVRGVEVEGGDALLQLPEGSYSFRREKGSLRIDPEFPQDGWIRGLNLAIPLALAFSTVLTVHDVYYPKRAALQITETFSLSAATLSSYGLTVSLIGFDIALYKKRRKAEEAFSYLRIAKEQALHSAGEHYQRAENLLALGQLEEALRFYMKVLDGFKDSPLYPYALFKTARIYFLTGEDSLAAIEFNLIADHFPLPDLYDKARRGLADILLRQGAYRESIEQLHQMVLIDPLYGEEEIKLLEAEILETWFGDEPAILGEVTTAYAALLEDYPDSESLDLYRYKTAYYLYLGERGSEAQEFLDAIDTALIDEDLARKVRDLRRSLGMMR